MRTRRRRRLPPGRFGQYIGFKRLVAILSKRPGVYDPRGLAAWIGRRKYGKAAFQRMALLGRLKKRGLRRRVRPTRRIGIR